MGLLNKLKSAVKFFKADYRDSTFYDFSAVVRAKFYVFEYTQLNKFTYVETLPVQINPDNYQKIKKVGIEGQIQFNDLISGNSNHEAMNDDSMNLRLFFNIVDEYKLRTNNGVLPLSIDLDAITIINRLYQYATSDYRVLLKWGPLEYISYISNVTCEYNSFSPYGEPLSADVNLTLHKHNPGSFSSGGGNTGVDDIRSSMADQINWSDIDTTNIKDRALVAGQLAAGEIANEALPSIFKKIR